MADSRVGVLKNLTRRHGVKVAAAVSVEDSCLAMGEVVGHDSIVSASKMNSAVVVFLKSVEKANELVEKGIVVNNLFTPVLPLSTPSKKVTLSNIPPFVSDDTLVKILSRYGKLVSPIKKILIGTASPLLKHVVSFRRFAYMILKDSEELDLTFNIKVDNFDYVFYATTDKMKCFNCGGVGHLIRNCPKRNKEDNASTENNGSVSEAQDVVSDITEPVVSLQEDEVNATAVVSEGVSDIITESVLTKDKKDNVKCQLFELCDDVDLESDTTAFKIPGKRKGSSEVQSVKQKKTNIVDDDDDDKEGMESGNESSDSNFSFSQRASSSRDYEVEDIKIFLKATKNKRGVRVCEYFPDIKQFVDKTKMFMAESLFTNKEIYRLKKIVRILNPDLVNDNS
ncbi:hypothetical protein E1301_Tti024117 [Triplophysa tibetana]|uniref:CCHC-type domain-containing protein n=1 Tax=Triplophysa tibetana TaxID=1572043 RepID=A0A5A9MW95_9TELE|nr:hypothetical protein E1301_Tti024117 [Triplophysa tibetana]